MAEQAIRVGRSSPDRVFFPVIALTIIIFVVIGFAQSYYFSAFTEAPALSGLLHLHGLLFSAWLLLFLSQALLIRSGQASVHRRLGAVGVGLAPLMIIVGALVVIEGALQFPVPAWLYSIAFGDLVMFGFFVALAVHYRAKSAIHKRLMLLATITIIDAGTARWPFMTTIFQDDPTLIVGAIWMYALADLLIVVALVYDRVAHGRIHPTYVWGGMALVISQAARLAVIETAPWQALSGALLRLTQ